MWYDLIEMLHLTNVIFNSDFLYPLLYYDDEPHILSHPWLNFIQVNTPSLVSPLCFIE